MEDNNANKDGLENSSNESSLNQEKDISTNNIAENNSLNEVNTEVESTENNQSIIEQDSSILQMYEFYKSKQYNDKKEISCVNGKTIAIFITLILLCVATFISCIVIDLNGTSYLENASLGESTQEDDINADTSQHYDFNSNNGISIQQYEPPQRDDSTYMNDNGTYTVAGVAKYSGNSIVAIYVSTDGVNLTGMGSGIVFSDEGYILTNAHVIEDANFIIGIMPDETQINLSFVGMNSELDIAVLQSDNKDIPVATMGNSDSVILGEDVVAIGNPAGLTGTVTKGIVSSINRTYVTSDNIERTYIQTDSAISPGNSGGALLNMYGQVIGITSLKISEDETYEGLGFAICINDALDCANTLIKNRFKIGITFNLESNEIQIASIDSSCSISNTDLKLGDVITQINDIDVYDYSSVMSALEGCKPGDKVSAKVERRSDDGLKNEFYIEFQLMPY